MRNENPETGFNLNNGYELANCRNARIRLLRQ